MFLSLDKSPGALNSIVLKSAILKLLLLVRGAALGRTTEEGLWDRSWSQKAQLWTFSRKYLGLGDPRRVLQS
jgi:hypothetical protein